MDDRTIMEDLLTAVKSTADLYLHGTVESATPAVHNAMDGRLGDTLAMQSEIYGRMAQMGWYPSEQAPQAKIDAARQKFSGCC